MNIRPKKINVLEGPWVDSTYHELVHPQIDRSNIPSFRQQTLPITQLYNSQYWGELRSAHRIDIAVPDFRHWYLSDKEFDIYVEKLSSVPFPVFCSIESPFDLGLSVNLEELAKKFFERTSRLVAAVKENQPYTTILSPAIGIVQEEYKNQYIDFFIQNRHLFDGYAVHCCNSMEEHILAQVSSFLNQVMDILPKPLWITKWAVPCFDNKVISSHLMGAENFEPHKSAAAQQRLQRSFSLIDSIASAGSQWFYVGLGKDLYKPRRVPGHHEYWNLLSTPAIPTEYLHSWQYWHFLGMTTADGKLKTSLLDSFVRFAVKNNG